MLLLGLLQSLYRLEASDWVFGLQGALFACNLFFTFFVLDTKKVTKKSQGSNEYSPLLPYSFVELLCIVVSAFVMLLLGLLQLDYK